MAPVSGIAGYQLVKQGNTVNAYKDTVVTINQVQPVLVRFSVNEGELDKVRKYLAAGPVPAVARPAKEDQSFKESGRLTVIDNSVDSQTGMISLQAEFDNAGLTLWPGQFVKVTATLVVEKDQVLIPNDALLSRQDGSFTFVVGADGKAELRSIKPGRTLRGAQTVVLEGLKPGEMVVTEGLIQVYPGAMVTVKQAENAK